ncbi:unnamed protein product [Paramecium sonneborni]|uniref:Uncharacterized protein n=1 Tax=Paramecium sonneborni TaxID=65129 RepID=A0A8S1KNI3_9CILI|nr:unnamed protein product [Paramecium sonneborni]
MTKLNKILNQFQIISGIGSFNEFAINFNGIKDKYQFINFNTKEFDNQYPDTKHNLSQLHHSHHLNLI